MPAGSLPYSPEPRMHIADDSSSRAVQARWPAGGREGLSLMLGA
jgi:hypothetical protein